MKRRVGVLVAAAWVCGCLLFSGVVDAGASPLSKIKKEDRTKWWLDARFGMMIHWGAYAQAGGYWKGEFEGGYSEWLKFRQIPNREYDSLIREFNPVDFDAEKWVEIAKNAGMKYIVFTAKHHDGFAMYDSKITDYDIVDRTRFHRDPVAELSAACQKAGLKFGVYYSVDRDWHHPDAACDDHYQQCNFWDYPENKSGGMARWHNSYFPNFAVKQITELVTRYPIDLVWFDGIGLKTRQEIALLDSIIHTNRPYCLINSRINTFLPNSDGDYGSKGDNETPGGYQAGGWENPGTLGFSYGYSARDSFMSPRQAIHNLVDIVSKGGNYLLNVGPDGKGVIIPEATSILREMGAWLEKYGSSVYGADGIPVNPPKNIRITVKPHKLFVHVTEWQDGEIEINGLENVIGNQLSGIKRVYMLADDQKRPMPFRYAAGKLSLDLSTCPLDVKKRSAYSEVLVLTDENDPPAKASSYAEWKHSGSLYILTTPDGADLPVSASEKDFPLLVRLTGEIFDFSEAEANGEDIRFSGKSGMPLAYQIEQWDPAGRTAAIWVRIPEILGNDRQEIKMYWGKIGATSESDGHAVFNESNGYLSVIHMDETLVDQAGTVRPENAGTTSTPGMVGMAKHFTEGQGIRCGEDITSFPSGNRAFSSEAWIRADLPDGLILGWGNEEKSGKVTMQFASPPRIRMDCYWSGANVSGESRLPLKQWLHVVHTYREGDSRIYVNGVHDGFSFSMKNPLDIKSPAGFWIGGWKNDYWYTGDIDEVRISNVSRSADWIRLCYENQKPMQTLAGTPVQPGNDFSVSQTAVQLSEGASIDISAKAGGAQKVYWIIHRGGKDSVAAVDRFHCTLRAGRVVADEAFTLEWRAVFPDGTRSLIIPVKVKESIPEPLFTLSSPKTWNGRDTLVILPVVKNMADMISGGAGDLKYKWTLSGVAVIRKEASGRLLLTRSQGSGDLLVRLDLGNGGAWRSDSASIRITEPAKDAWIVRLPAKGEKPVDNQFYPRDCRNEGHLWYTGRLEQPADAAFIRIYSDGDLFDTQVKRLSDSRSYAFESRLKPGLVKYRIEFGTIDDGMEKVLERVANIVCGDAYIIDGQSNAEANDYGRAVNPYTSDWIRSFGCADTDPEKSRMKLWGNAVSYDNQGARLQIGYWGIELARQLVENQKIPVCFINGSVGGSRIDVHQRNESCPTDSTTIYGRLLWRVQQAGLTHGIRGVFWHQGENDQGAAGPTGRFGWENYQQYFVDMSAAWKQDYPNIRHYYVFQIWPRSCAMTENGSDNMLREVQRTLPRLYSNMSIMSTLGIIPPGTCHFPPEGYAAIAHLIGPLVEKFNYGITTEGPVSPPDLVKAYYTGAVHDEIALEFDQPVIWKDSLVTQFYIDGQSGRVESGSAIANIVRLKLKIPSGARHITYLDSKSWSQENILRGTNGIAALTFCSVGIGETGLIPVTDRNVQSGLSPYNWVFRNGGISASTNGASVTVRFKGTRHVALRISTSHMVFDDPKRFPIMAWSVNGGEIQTHQVSAGETFVLLSTDIDDPVIDLYIKGMSPFEDRYTGDLPANSFRITGFLVDEGGVTARMKLPKKTWLTFGDSILSGDGASLGEDQGRPEDDSWAASDDARASYGYLLARRFGFRESRIAFGGYDWGGGMAHVPSLTALVDSITSTSGRLQGRKLYPTPDVVFINLGENGAPSQLEVFRALEKIRNRSSLSTKIMVMVPASGRARTAITEAFLAYRDSAGDSRVFLVDLGRLAFATCDGQHPTAAGHETIYQAALPKVQSILAGKYRSPERIKLWNGQAPAGPGHTDNRTPRITVHYPAHPNGALMVICPGGGYGGLVKGPEGHEMAEWLNQNGITGVVLEYRLPGGNPLIPLVDVQRAIRLCRSSASKWGCDPRRIGVMGFSAGGHLASMAATHYNQDVEGTGDEPGRVSSRPDFAVLIYPVITMGPKTHEGSRNNLLGPHPGDDLVNWYSSEKQVNGETPPSFLAHAQDDSMVSPDNSLMFYDALQSHRIPSSYVRLPYGEHGLNGYSGPMWEEWKEKCLNWMEDMKFIPNRGKR